MAVDSQGQRSSQEKKSYKELQEAYEKAKAKYNEQIFPDAFEADKTFEELDNPVRYAKMQMWALPELKEQEEDAVEAAEEANRYMEKLSQQSGEGENSKEKTARMTNSPELNLREIASRVYQTLNGAI